ncbi:hypothetical protein BJF80_03270 [Serinicoccus sp. CUA-874]|uniref:hypothetical protein n=1 Tax=Serinicoccus sp. CUA-874 TaxID=1517939 RepID=UPI000964D844|nr:hypothetical protein [Serinicoccus sp. CUA-874]OLT17206.1 hypothetical protein BJF80_03270 [Serinicoccus sp. CUA-874]OLT30176.1 hypothetical protein BJF82_15800 [Kytococcus sp. CUA-901]
MKYLNRDALGLPKNLPHDIVPALRAAFPSAEVDFFGGDDPIAVEVESAVDPGFEVAFFMPEMATCDGLPEQQAMVALCMAQECRNHGVRIVMTSDDAAQACTVEEGDTVADLLNPDRWSFIDPNLLGHGDIMHSYPSPDQDD